jgi:hypothetical protein
MIKHHKEQQGKNCTAQAALELGLAHERSGGGGGEATVLQSMHKCPY